ncbi:MAG TPA: AsnC family transcriptional regulator [Trebonia sp.]|nr:AsnC family transcriptional regulator [Trebonia sp.]
METLTVDELDRQLVQCLGVDGRASFSRIAEILGVSDQTVARRYRRLRSSGLLRVVGLKARHKVGALGWFLRMRCVPGAGPAIAAALARRTDTSWIQLLSGNTEVLCTLRGDAREDRDSLLAKLPRSGRIVAVTAHSLLHMFTGGPEALGFLEVLPAGRVEPLRRPVRDGRVELGELDFALFEALGMDGRASYADLAAATGYSESTVRRRVDQLRDVGVLYFDLELDMAAFGFRSSAWLWISAAPARLAATGAALATFPEIAYAVATTGPANLVACAICRDEPAFYQFLTEKIGSLPGVERVETAPVIRTVKQASTVVVPGHFSPERTVASLRG